MPGGEGRRRCWSTSSSRRPRSTTPTILRCLHGVESPRPHLASTPPCSSPIREVGRRSAAPRFPLVCCRCASAAEEPRSKPPRTTHARLVQEPVDAPPRNHAARRLLYPAPPWPLGRTAARALGRPRTRARVRTPASPEEGRPSLALEPAQPAWPPFRRSWPRATLRRGCAHIARRRLALLDPTAALEQPRCRARSCPAPLSRRRRGPAEPGPARAYAVAPPS